MLAAALHALCRVDGDGDPQEGRGQGVVQDRHHHQLQPLHAAHWKARARGRLQGRGHAADRAVQELLLRAGVVKPQHVAQADGVPARAPRHAGAGGRGRGAHARRHGRAAARGGARACAARAPARGLAGVADEAGLLAQAAVQRHARWRARGHGVVPADVQRHLQGVAVDHLPAQDAHAQAGRDLARIAGARG